jgi:hypothetical protein
MLHRQRPERSIYDSRSNRAVVQIVRQLILNIYKDVARYRSSLAPGLISTWVKMPLFGESRPQSDHEW